MAIGMLHYMSGNARAAIRMLEGAGELTPDAMFALSAAYTAIGASAQGADIFLRLKTSASSYSADELLDGADLENLKLPAMQRRNWGPHMQLLARGDFQAYGTALFERGELLPEYARGATFLRLRSGKRLPRWNGERVRHLAVLFADGHGDTFCFGRYLTGLRTKVGRVSAIMSRPVIALVARAAANIECVPLDDCSAAMNAADAYADSWSLPALSSEGFGISSWLAPSEELAEQWQQDAPGLHVGIAWGGSNWNQADALRSIPAHMLASLLRVSGVTWHSLQLGPKAAEIPPGVIDYSRRLSDFDDTAALMSGLDLVISVDTAVANLAAAMGHPVWVLVERDNDFRWGLEGDTTPWFRSARVFRQREGWLRVLRNVRVALAES